MQKGRKTVIQNDSQKVNDRFQLRIIKIECIIAENIKFETKKKDYI